MITIRFHHHFAALLIIAIFGLLALFLMYSQYVQWQERIELPQQQEIPLQPIVEQPISLDKLAEEYIITANDYTKKAFEFENVAQKLNLKAPREEWLTTKKMLVSAIQNYQKSMDENNKAIDVLQTLPQKATLLKHRMLANKLTSKSIECHILTLAFIDGFLDENMDKLKELHPEIRGCITERKQLEEEAKALNQQT